MSASPRSAEAKAASEQRSEAANHALLRCFIAILSVAFFGQGMVGLGWAGISDIAPKTLMGLTGGLFNGMTNLSGIITPLVIGYIVSSNRIFCRCAGLHRRGCIVGGVFLHLYSW